jgi:hypothetical protein
MARGNSWDLKNRNIDSILIIFRKFIKLTSRRKNLALKKNLTPGVGKTKNTYHAQKFEKRCF